MSSVNAIDPEGMYAFNTFPSIGINLSRETIRRARRDGTFPEPVQVSRGRVAWLGRPLIKWKQGLACKAKRRG